MLTLLLLKNLGVDKLLLKLIDLGLVLGKVQGITLILLRDHVVVVVKQRVLQKQTKSRGFCNGDLTGSEAVVDTADRATGTDDHHGDSNHLADLVHHERLTMDVYRQPLSAVDNDRVENLERFDMSLGTGVLEGLVDSEVVVVIGSNELPESFPDLL